MTWDGSLSVVSNISMVMFWGRPITMISDGLAKGFVVGFQNFRILQKL